MENAGNNSADEDEDKDEDEDGGRGADRGGSAKAVAKRIYKKALKILKRKLYFEKIFPTDAEKDSLPYSCWTSVVVSMDHIDGGSTTACEMFYTFGYDNTVHPFTSSSVS